MEITDSLEVTVFVVALVTLGLAVWSLGISHTDHLVLRRLQQNGIKRLTITARLMRDVARTLCAGAMVAAAGICLHLPPDRDPVALVLKGAMLATSVFLGMAVFMDFRWRKLIDAALEAQDTVHGRG